MTRYVDVWRRALRLGSPVVASKLLRSLMGTTDVLIAASLSPAAIVGLGIADIYHKVSMRIGGGLATGAGTLISQDTGAAAAANRSDALSQAIVVAFLVGIPIAIIGLLYGETLLRLIGAGENAAHLGAVYLSIIVLAIPLENVSGVNTRGLQSIGNTTIPAVVSVGANVINIATSVILGVGLLGAPELGIVGVGIGTFVAVGIEFLVLAGVIYANADLSIVRPRQWTILEQLLRISLPQIGMGLVTSVAIVPFNAILLGFGTAVNAGYQLAWRFYRQLVGPFASALAVVNSIITGQTIGDGDRDRVFESVYAILLLGGAISILAAAILILGVQTIAPYLSESTRTVRYARAFSFALGISAVLAICNNVFSSALSAGSETRIPLIERIVGMFGGLVGVTYVTGTVLGWGASGALLGVVSSYLLMLAVTSAGFYFTDWAGRATAMMEQRGSTN